MDGLPVHPAAHLPPRLARQDSLFNSLQTIQNTALKKKSPARGQPQAMAQLTSIESMGALDIYSDPLSVRKTGIICTIGPKTASVESLTALRRAGMNIVRMNFSHGSYEYHGGVIANLRQSMKETPGVSVGLALDTKGPEIRTGLLIDDQELQLKKDDIITLTTDEKYKESCSKDHLWIDYKSLPQAIEIDGTIFVDDGLIDLRVVEKGEDWLKCRVQNNGSLGSRKGCNLPEVDVDLPALSEKDKRDLQWGVEQGVDMIFASFIRKASDVEEVRTVLGEKGKNIKIISKIENHEGVRNFGEILKVTDGVMVARGDLGIEIDPWKVFLAQKMMVAQCNLAGKPVIVATQMLESMTQNPRPTRAEVSDVANAVLDGADCVMLSGETAKGAFPTKAVEMMHWICWEAESALLFESHFDSLRRASLRHIAGVTVAETLASSCVLASFDQHLAGIVVLTTSGESARLLSKYRPRCPIIAVTRNEQTSRQIHLYRGVYPLVYDEPQTPSDFQESVDHRVQWAVEIFKRRNILETGDRIAVIQGWQAGVGYTNTLRILDVL